uniref:Uncharacterized protein n=1 Tax=Plectus sambesii TaxID=2011161 RepID=A0A914WIV5_9BILA
MSQRYEITEGLTRRDGHKELTSTAGQVVVVTPFMRHHCCFGCLTLYQGNLLVAVFEIVQLGRLNSENGCYKIGENPISACFTKRNKTVSNI